jgi:hypothetical protein
MLRRIQAAAAALLLLAPALPGATEVRGRYDPRPLKDGYLYLGSAPGLNVGGNALPRALYFDVLQVGYVLPTGIDLSFALSGMNYVPDQGDYSISMARFAVGYRPFLRDPLPVIQPYALAGGGFGGEGRYACAPEPGCNPARDECRDVCGRANWAGDLFAGAGVDLTTRLFDVGGQQVLGYAGVQARFEWIPSRYEMAVITFPIGLKLQ